MRFKFPKPSPALVIALIALIAAVGGTAIARQTGGPTTKIPKVTTLKRTISPGATGLLAEAPGALRVTIGNCRPGETPSTKQYTVRLTNLSHELIRVGDFIGGGKQSQTVPAGG